MPGGDIELIHQERRIDMHLIIRVGNGTPLLSGDEEPAAAPGPGPLSPAAADSIRQ
jgi:hypothetical protein